MSTGDVICTYCGGWMGFSQSAGHLFIMPPRGPFFCSEDCRELCEREIPLPDNYVPRGLFTKAEFKKEPQNE